MQTEFVSIGFCCVTTSFLKALGYANNGYPFDWLFTSLEMVKHCLETRFKYFLDKSYYQRDDAMRHLYYQNMINTDQIYRHHGEKVNPPIFRHHSLFDQETYQSFTNKCKRFLELYDNKIENKKLCLVYTINYYYEKEEYDLTDIKDLYKTIKESSPKTELVIIKLIEDNIKRTFSLSFKEDNLYFYNVYYDKWNGLNQTQETLSTINECLKNHYL
jgi:hypothetical protein